MEPTVDPTVEEEEQALLHAAAEAAGRARFDSAAALVEAMLGAPATAVQQELAQWYEALRVAARACRKATGMTQSQFAEKTGRQQSELSRLERGLGPMTAIGRIKEHIEDSGGRFDWSATDREGRAYSGAAGPADSRAGSLLSVEGGLFAVSDIALLGRALAAFDEAMRAAQLDPDGRQEILKAAMRRLVQAPPDAAAGNGPQPAHKRVRKKRWPKRPQTAVRS